MSIKNNEETKFCECGRVLVNGKCKYTHKPKRKKQPHLRGNSKWAKQKGMFEGLKGNNA